MNLPPEIASSLRRVLGRVRRIQLLKGILATLAALVFSLVAIMLIDWAFVVERRALRWVMTGSALLVTLITFFRYVVAPLSKRISLTRVARYVETHHPDMQERISTAVSLAGRGDAGSQVLIDEVIKEAAMDASRVNASSELSAGAARKPTWTALTALGILGGLFACFPKITPLLFARAVAPYADLGNVYSYSVRHLSADKQVVTAGDSFTIEAAYKSEKEKRAVLILTYPDGTEVREQMAETPGLAGLQEGERPLSFRLPTQPDRAP